MASTRLSAATSARCFISVEANVNKIGMVESKSAAVDLGASIGVFDPHSCAEHHLRARGVDDLIPSVIFGSANVRSGVA